MLEEKQKFFKAVCACESKDCFPSTAKEKQQKQEKLNDYWNHSSSEQLRSCHLACDKLLTSLDLFWHNSHSDMTEPTILLIFTCIMSSKWEALWRHELPLNLRRWKSEMWTVLQFDFPWYHRICYSGLIYQAKLKLS